MITDPAHFDMTPQEEDALNERNARKRAELLKVFATLAKEYARRGDVVLREQASCSWREIATEAEAARAPHYLTWLGRK